MDFLRKVIAGLVIVFAITAHTAVPYPTVTAGGGISEWVISTDYFVDDVVWESEDFYKSLSDHTSGGDFPTDFASNLWVRMSDDINFISASTDGGIVRWDGVTGDVVQDSIVVVDDFGNITDINTLAIGQATSPSTTSLIDFSSTIAGTRPWTFLSTAQRDAIVSPAIGLAIYNTDTNLVNVFNGTTWGAVGGGISAWMATTNYNINDVVYDGSDSSQAIYRANATFVSGGVFNPTNWTELSQHINIPLSATDNAVLRFNGAGGDDVQESGVLIDDSDNISGIANINFNGDVVFEQNQTNITANTADGVDLGNLVLAAGGDISSDRGATMFMYGNEQGGAGQAGGWRLVLGDISDSKFSVRDSANAEIFDVLETGEINLPMLTPSQNLSLDALGNVISTPTNVSSGSVTGVLPVEHGGTGSSVLTTDRLLYYDGTSISSTASLSFDESIFEVSTPNGSIPMTKMNQASRLALTPVNGTTVYDTDDQKPYFYDGSNWKPIGALAVSSSQLSVSDYSEILFPLDQVTVTDTTAGLEKVRIETGNDSFLTNGSFEHETYTTGWTASGSATYDLESTDVWEGSQAVSVSSSGGTQSFELLQSKTLPQYEGNTLGFTCMVKSDSAKVKLCTESGADEEDCVYHDGNGMWKKMQAIMMVDSTGVMVGSVKNDPNEDASVVVDSCEWSNDPLKIKSGAKLSSWKTYSPTLVGFGIPTNLNFNYRQVGDAYEIQGFFTCGTPTAVTAEIPIPNGHTASATYDTGVASRKHIIGYGRRDDNLSVFPLADTGLTYIGLAFGSGSPSINFRNGNDICVNGQEVTIHGTVKVNELNAGSKEILTASDIVSSETMAFQFKGSGTGAIDCSTDPVGTYTTYDKAGSSNTFSQCTSAPTTPPTNLDGFKTSSTSFTGSTGCTTSIARFDICVGKGFRGINVFGYEGTAKSSNSLRLKKVSVGANAFGLDKFYNQSTGLLSLNAGLADTGSNTAREWMRTTGSPYNGDAYLHFEASKNPVVNAMETIPIVDYSWENEFSARVDNNGVCSITSENKSFLDSADPCTRVAQGEIQLNFKVGFFTVPPSIVALTESSVISGQVHTSVFGISTTSATITTENSANTDVDLPFSVHVSRQGSDYKERGSTAAIIAQPTCFIKDVNANNTSGGDCIAGSYITRQLNTLEGQCDGISISSNVVTVPRGSWKLTGFAPAHDVDRHKAKWVRDPNGSPSDSVLGSPERATSTNGMSSKSHMKGEFTVAGITEEFEVQHRCETTKASNGFGIASGFGDNEVYTQIGITRIK